MNVLLSDLPLVSDWWNWRHVESNGHGRAEEDDVTPVGEKSSVGRSAKNRQSGQKLTLPHDLTRKRATADGEEQSH